MKLRNILIIGGIVFIFVLGMMGCFVLSVHPLYFEKDLVFEQDLVGTWGPKEHEKDLEELWIFKKSGDKSYRLIIKVKDEGVTEGMWQQMLDYANDKGWKGGAYKNLNLPFETKFMGQPQAVRERMVKRVEDFVYNMLANVFNAEDTADLAVAAINKAGSHDLGPKVERIEDPAEWTGDKIAERAATLDTDKGPEGDFDD